jgi:hypothetical protein
VSEGTRLVELATLIKESLDGDPGSPGRFPGMGTSIYLVGFINNTVLPRLRVTHGTEAMKPIGRFMKNYTPGQVQLILAELRQVSSENSKR